MNNYYDKDKSYSYKMFFFAMIGIFSLLIILSIGANCQNIEQKKVTYEDVINYTKYCKTRSEIIIGFKFFVSLGQAQMTITAVSEIYKDQYKATTYIPDTFRIRKCDYVELLDPSYGPFDSVQPIKLIIAPTSEGFYRWFNAKKDNENN